MLGILDLALPMTSLVVMVRASLSISYVFHPEGIGGIGVGYGPGLGPGPGGTGPGSGLSFDNPTDNPIIRAIKQKAPTMIQILYF